MGWANEVKKAVSIIGDDGYLEHLFAAFENGHITEDEWHQADKAHRFVARGGVRRDLVARHLPLSSASSPRAPLIASAAGRSTRIDTRRFMPATTGGAWDFGWLDADHLLEERGAEEARRWLGEVA